MVSESYFLPGEHFCIDTYGAQLPVHQKLCKEDFRLFWRGFSSLGESYFHTVFNKTVENLNVTFTFLNRAA